MHGAPPTDETYLRSVSLSLRDKIHGPWGGPKGTPGVAKSSQERPTGAQGIQIEPQGGPKGTPGGSKWDPRGAKWEARGVQVAAGGARETPKCKKMKNYKMKIIGNENCCFYIGFNRKNEHP